MNRQNGYWMVVAGLLWLAGSAWAQQMAPVNPAFVQWQRERAAKAAAGQTPGEAKPRAARTAAVRGETGGEEEDFGFVPSMLDMGYLSNLNNNLTQGAGDEPERTYDLRTAGALTAVRDQGNYGNCWAFATLGSLESWIKKSEGIDTDFSENHLSNLHGWNQGFGDGGNAQMAEAYLVRWEGPVEERNDAYPRPGKSVETQAARHVQRVRWIPGRTSYLDLDGIKSALKKYGALQTEYYHVAGHYNKKTASYYFNPVPAFRLSNHSVDVVGWDDGYSRKNFSPEPPGDGAFIARNSWGSDWGDGGYFHVSYYDESFAWGALHSFSSAEAPDNYDGIYQYDPLGMVGSLGYGGPTAWGANMFTASADSKVAAAGFYAMTPRTTYTLHVYSGCRPNEPRSGMLAAQQSGTVDMAGFVTVPLETPVAVSAGQRFSVVLQLTTPGYGYPLAAEYAVAGYSSAAKASAGQSFLSANGTLWDDFTKRVSSTANFCCKAYVKAEAVSKVLTGLSIDGVNSLKAGNSASFSCAAEYSDGSSKPVVPEWTIVEGIEWATVTSEGVVTAAEVEEPQMVTLQALYSEDGETQTATWKLHVTVAAPVAPSVLTATEGTDDSCVRLAWNTSTGASSYAVYRGPTENSANAAYLGSVTVPRYADTAAEPGVNYRYFVKAKNDSGSSAFSDGAWGWRALAAPTGLEASDGTREDCVELVWNRSEGASCYRIWRVSADDPDAEAVAVSDWQTACRFEDATATAGVKYTYTVAAALDTDGTRSSGFSIPDEGFCTGPIVLSALEIAGPISLFSRESGTYGCTALYTDGSRTQVAPAWTLDGGGLATDGEGRAFATAPAASENTAMTLSAAYTDGDIRATATLTITVASVTPSAPETLTLVSATEAGVALAWSAVEDASSYQLWRANDGEAAAVVASTTATNHTDASAIPGVSYIYRIASANGAGVGEPGEACVTATRPISAPSGVSASYGTYADKVLVAWNASEGASHYRVWRLENTDGEKTALGVWQDALSFEDTAAAAGVAYYYSVQAAADGEGRAASAFGEPALGLRKAVARPVSLAVLGPESVASESTAAYSAKVRYDNGTTRAVTPVWTLSGGGDRAEIGADGVLSVGLLSEDLPVTLSASFTDEAGTVEGSLDVMLVAPLVKVANVVSLSAKPRWPWNGWVDVDYVLETVPSGTVAKVTLSGYDFDHQTALAATTLAGDGARGATVKAGPHRLSWNLGADYPDFHASEISVSLDAVPADPVDPDDPDALTLRKGGLAVAFYDLPSAEWPYSTWRSSYGDMVEFFSPMTPALATNTVYVGEVLDFGYTPWGGMCALPGKYAQAAIDNFAALFTGYIDIPTNGTYRFQTFSDDGMVLYIDRQLVFGAWDTQDRSNEYGGDIALEAGVHEIAFAYHERGERQGFTLYWKVPGAGVRVALSQSVLSYDVSDDGGSSTPEDPSAPLAPMPPANPDAYRSGGLCAVFSDLGAALYPYATWSAAYESMMDFFDGVESVLSTNTAYVGSVFDFGYTPFGGTCLFPGKYGKASADDFVALFTGYIEIPETGSYRFLTKGDDGTALYIDRQLVYSAFEGQNLSPEYGGDIALEAGWHEMAFAYHERGERQGVTLYWRTPSGSNRVALPQTVLHFAEEESGEEVPGGGDEPGETVQPLAPVVPENAEALRSGGLSAEFVDLASTALPYATWRASHESMRDFFAARTTTISTNTAYWGATFNSGYTPFGGDCLFPGKYAHAAADDFAALFTGYINIPETDTYLFEAHTDDGVVMYVDRQMVFGACEGALGAEYGGEIALAAGWHEVAMAYHERGERQGTTLYWKRPAENSRSEVQQSVLYYPVEDGEEPEEPENPEVPSALLVGGLNAAFFDLGSRQSPYGIWATSHAAMEDYFAALVPVISTNTASWGEFFNSGYTTFGGVGTCTFPGKYAHPSADDFVALFTGFVDIPADGTYLFQTAVDDGSTLYIDGRLVYEVHGTGDTLGGEISLKAGLQKIAIAYHEIGERQGFSIYWKRPGDFERSLLPQANLRYAADGEAAP